MTRMHAALPAPLAFAAALPAVAPTLRRVLLLSALTLLLALAALPAQAQPKVVASLKPLQLIAAALMDGTAQPQLLSEGSVDPHHHALRPSERQVLEDADLLFWVGPALEGWLEKVVPELRARSVAGLEAPGLEPLQGPRGIDPHIWLDSGNARLLAAALVKVLSEVDSANTGRYTANLTDFERGLQEADAAIAARLAGLETRPYAVYHDAFAYFEARYGLGHVAAFTEDEELKPGVRRLLALRRELSEAGVRCILIEPGINEEELSSVTSGQRFVTVDVLAAGFAPAKDAYARFLLGVGEAFADCLS